MLRDVLAAKGEAVVLWDDALRMIWMSSEAQRRVQMARCRAEFDNAAAAAFRQLKDARALGTPAPSTRLQLDLGVSGLSADFRCVRTTGARPWLLAQLNAGRSGDPRLARLTRAELEVLRKLVAGASNREIASELQVSLETIRTHVSRVLSKLEVSSRAKAANLARDAWAKHG